MNYYEMLGVSSSASEKEIKKAYKKAMREVHPDNIASSGISEEEATKKSQLYNEAANVLLNAGLRKEYDNSLRSASTGGTEGNTDSSRQATAMPEHIRKVRNMIYNAEGTSDYIKILNIIKKGEYTASEKKEMISYLTSYVKYVCLDNVTTVEDAKRRMKEITKTIMWFIWLCILTYLVHFISGFLGVVLTLFIGFRALRYAFYIPCHISEFNRIRRCVKRARMLTNGGFDFTSVNSFTVYR